MKPNKAIF